MNNLKLKTYSWSYSFSLTVIFFVLIVLFSLDLSANAYVNDISDLNLSEILLLMFTVFRMIRLVTYDSVSQYIRDLFLDCKEVSKNGEVYIQRDKPKSGIRRLLTDLISCPWCVSVWLTLFVTYFYLRVPGIWFLYLVLSVSGVASVIQIIANWIGWSAENKKLTTLNLDK